MVGILEMNLAAISMNGSAADDNDLTRHPVVGCA